MLFLFRLTTKIAIYFVYLCREKYCLMKNKTRIFFLFLLVSIPVWAGDSIKATRPSFIAVNFTEGFALPSQKIAPNGSDKTPRFSALTLKYGLSARGDCWEDYLYGLPYRGIGVYLPEFSNKVDLGDPFSVFLFQGGRLARINRIVSVNYEINLGLSFNWKHYDVVQRPWLMALGSSTNVHLAGNWYFKWRLSRYVDLQTGVSITHFSNGALRTPNNGLNLASAYVGLAYNLHPEKKDKVLTEAGTYIPPKFEKSRVHDLSFIATTRTIKMDTTGTNARCKYPKRHFKVAGINYSYMVHNTRRFMWGPSVEALYDESSNAVITGDTDPYTNEYTEYVRLGKVTDRFSVGLSLKGELTMPGYSIFANLGYDVLHNNKRDKSLYQIYGLKVYLTDNLSASFAVRSTNLTRSQFLYLNLGYTIRQYKRK